MTIKVSAFPAASTNMGSTDTVTGLQGGANVNFAQEQIFRGADAAPGSGGNGGYRHLYGGTSDGVGQGGFVYLVGGTAGDGGSGGTVFNKGGGAYGASGGNGGSANLYGGQGKGSGMFGGDVTIQAGAGTGGATAGNVIILGIPVAASAPAIPTNALWINSATRVLTVK